MTQEKIIDRDFRDWIVTVEQADAIAAGDREAANKFYSDNYNTLEKMAHKYAARKNRALGYEAYSVCDMMTDLYIDLPHLNWQNIYKLVCDIQDASFLWSVSGGYTMRKEQCLPVQGTFYENGVKKRYARPSAIDMVFGAFSLDNVMVGETESATFGDFLSAPKEYEPDYIHDDNGMSAQALVTLLQDMFSIHECSVLRYMLDGYSSGEIARLTGEQHSNVIACTKRIRYKLVMHYD